VGLIEKLVGKEAFEGKGTFYGWNEVEYGELKKRQEGERSGLGKEA
jgi:hypothetical protein